MCANKCAHATRGRSVTPQDSKKESQHYHVVALEGCMGTCRCARSTMCHFKLHIHVDRPAHVLVLEHGANTGILPHQVVVLGCSTY